MCSVKSRVGTLGGPASSMSTLRPRSAASLATQPPLAPDPTMSTSYGMVCTRPTPGIDLKKTVPPSVQAQHKHQIAGDGEEILVPGLRPIIAKLAGTPKENDGGMGASRRGAVCSVDD